MNDLSSRKKLVKRWFVFLQKEICDQYENLENLTINQYTIPNDEEMFSIETIPYFDPDTGSSYTHANRIGIDAILYP